MVVMWDMDGVLANFNKAYIGLANKMFDLSLNVEKKPDTWDELENTIGSDKVDRIWNHIKQSGDFWYKLESLATPEEWARIAQLDANQYFVTSRVGQRVREQTDDWLFGQFVDTELDLPRYCVMVSSRKADSANALNANYTIDDKAGNVLAVYYNSPPERRVYVLDTPYNQFDTRTVGSRVRRVQTVSSFLDDIEGGK